MLVSRVNWFKTLDLWFDRPHKVRVENNDYVGCVDIHNRTKFVWITTNGWESLSWLHWVIIKVYSNTNIEMHIPFKFFSYIHRLWHYFCFKKCIICIIIIIINYHFICILLLWSTQKPYVGVFKWRQQVHMMYALSEGCTPQGPNNSGRRTLHTKYKLTSL